MKGFRRTVVLLLVLAVSLTACGRRLPDETAADTAPDTAAEETVVDAGADEAEATEAAVAEETDAEAADTVEEATEEAGEEVAAEDAAEEETVAEEPAVDTSDPFAVRVAESDPANGETLFNTMNQTGFACSTCHLVDSEQMLVGPGMLGIASRAATRVEGETAPEYLYHSIAAPNDYIVETYPVGVMPQTYTDVYSEDEIYDIVAYLMTLEDPNAAQAEAEPTAAPEEDAAAEEEDAAAEEEDAAAEEEATEEVAAAEEETATEEAAVEEETPTEEIVEATATPQVIVVTATPVEVAAEPETASEADAAAEEEAVVESGEPDIVVTLASLGIASYGEDVFNREVIEGASCASCHDVSTGEYINGPSLVNVEELAAEAGVSPERFLYESMVNPEAHPDLDENYADLLSSAEIYDVVAYLLSIDAVGVEVEAAPEGEASSEEPAQASGEDSFTVAAANADAAHGEELFNTMNDSGFMCATCHYVDSTDMLVGPGLLGVADRAEERVEGQSAAEYLYTSIMETNAYVVEGYPESVMPIFYEDIYTDEEVYDLVAYLLTLHE